MSVHLFKKRDVSESRYGQNISSRSSSRKLGKVDDQRMMDGFILLGIHVITGRRVRRRPKVEWQQTRQRYDKSPTKIYTTWARMLSDRNVFCSLGGGEKQRGPIPLGRFFFGGGWSLAPDPCSVKTILAGKVRSFRVYSPEFS